MSLADARAELARLRLRLDDAILPFWSSQGFDPSCDMFHERFDFAGRPVADLPRRTMVQARQIYVCSQATLRGMVPDGGALAERALRTLLDHACDGDDGQAGFAFALHPGGRVQSDVRDSYAHAFVLFALASAYRLSGEPRLRRVIERTLGFIDRCLVDPLHGGLFDRYPDPSPAKAQNPQMHLLEAYLALHDAMPDGPFLEQAGGVVDRFSRQMFRADPGVLPEVFGPDWTPSGDTTYEPGHHFEWAWLLDRHRAATGIPLPEAADILWSTACEAGVAASGLIFDEVGFDRRPRKSGHRLWPHAEAVKAAAVRVAAGQSSAEPVLAAMLRVLNDTFAGRPFAGGWIDRVGPEGEILLDFVPASSLYHLYGAWAEADRLLGGA